MMTKTGRKAERHVSGKPVPETHASEKTPFAPDAGQVPLSDHDRSKDTFFVQVAAMADAMIAAHGKDFAIGTLVLAAKFIAEGKPFGHPSQANSPSTATADTVPD